MQKYNPNIHHRRSIRLKGYDYSKAGLYFITICVKDRECLFGEIKDGKMIMNDAGKMIEKWFYELMNKFPDIRSDEMIVMPNHFHCVVENVGTTVVGPDLRVCPDNNSQSLQNVQSNRITPTIGEKEILGEHQSAISGLSKK